MAKRKSVEDLYQAIFSIRETLQDAVQMASEVSVIADAFGGEIARVVTEQINTYFIPGISKFIDDKETPGAMAPLVTFLDSVPLAMTREEPNPEQTTPTPIQSPNLSAPPTGSAEGSFAQQTSVQESYKAPIKRMKESSPIMEAASKSVGTKIFEAMESWAVFRCRKGGDAVQIVGNLHEAEAKLRAERLNEDVKDYDMFTYEARKQENIVLGKKQELAKTKVQESGVQPADLDDWLNNEDSEDSEDYEEDNLGEIIGGEDLDFF